MVSVSVFAQNFTDENGLKQGKWEVKYDNGKIQYIGTFKDGVEQGFFKFFYNSGELKATKEFFHDGLAAATHIFYKNGNIRSIENIVSGLSKGPRLFFYREGGLKFISYYKNNISFGNNNFTSSDILSTPDPLNTNSQNFSFSHFLFNVDLYPQ